MGTEINQASVEAFAKSMLTGLIALLTEHLPAAQEAGLDQDKIAEIAEEAAHDKCAEIAEEAASDYVNDHLSDMIVDEIPTWVMDLDESDILSTDNVEDIAASQAQEALDNVSWEYDYELVTKDNLADAVSDAMLDEVHKAVKSQIEETLSDWLRKEANMDFLLDMALGRMLHLVHNQQAR